MRRLLQMIPVVLSVVCINFVLIQLAPGDAAIFLAGREADPAYIEAIRHQYGLDLPILTQFVRYLGQLLQGNFGRSFISGRPVLVVIGERIGPTLLLVFAGVGVAAVLGTILGAQAARRMGTPYDTTMSLLSIVSYAIPVFWLGLMLILFFGIKLRWLPTSGMRSVLPLRSALDRAIDVVRHLILPAVTLGVAYLGQYIRLSRSSVAEVMKEDFITTARAIGYDENTIFIKHALRNALLPVVTIAGLHLGFIFAGATLTETVFAWPGMGRLIYDAILGRDFPLLMGCYTIMAVSVVLATLATDVLYAYLDPRVTYR